MNFNQCPLCHYDFLITEDMTKLSVLINCKGCCSSYLYKYMTGDYLSFICIVLPTNNYLCRLSLGNTGWRIIVGEKLGTLNIYGDDLSIWNFSDITTLTKQVEAYILFS